ncbi:MAG: hypothetical protein WCE64_13015 [Bacteroidales bacterium]
MNKTIIILIILVLSACSSRQDKARRVPVAKAGNSTLYYDMIPEQIKSGVAKADSSLVIQNYINKWVKRELMFRKAESNISSEKRDEIEQELNESRVNLIIYEYQRQMMLEKMDTIIADNELESYYAANESSFRLTSNIVKAQFIKLPAETPNLSRIRTLARSGSQKDLQELESLCYQFAEKYDDFNEKWVTMDRLSIEMNADINNQENFLKRNTFYETTDSSSVCLVTINDYRLRGTLSPFEYVRDDIKRIIWNSRRIAFIQALDNGIYEEALKNNDFKIY